MPLQESDLHLTRATAAAEGLIIEDRGDIWLAPWRDLRSKSKRPKELICRPAAESSLMQLHLLHARQMLLSCPAFPTMRGFTKYLGLQRANR